MNSSYKVGGKIQIECKDSSKVAVPSSRTCLKNGKFDGKIAVCKPKPKSTTTTTATTTTTTTTTTSTTTTTTTTTENSKYNEVDRESEPLNKDEESSHSRIAKNEEKEISNGNSGCDKLYHASLFVLLVFHVILDQN